MYRRERHRSGFDRQPSPKRSRRDGKPDAEREHITGLSDGGDSKKRRLPLEDSNPVDHTKTDVPRSRSYFQHDERGNIRQVRRGFDRRAAVEPRGRDLIRDELAISKKYKTDNLGQQEERLQAKGDNRDVWKHDGCFKMESEPSVPVRKRPAFTEKKIPLESEKTDNATAKPVRPGYSENPISESERRRERDRNTHHFDRSGKFPPGDAIEAQKRNVSSRERYAGNNNQRGRDRFYGKVGYRVNDERGKWKHDLFNDADKSPSRKNEDEQIAKVEALLAS